MQELPKNLQEFRENETWIYAKTYAEVWSHEYIVEEKVNKILFTELENHIDKLGHEEYFYDKKMIYLYFDKHAYWHMENIINRCLLEDTFAQRKQDNRLPKNI